jgi:hypothetical protein
MSIGRRPFVLDFGRRVGKNKKRFKELVAKTIFGGRGGRLIQKSGRTKEEFN